MTHTIGNKSGASRYFVEISTQKIKGKYFWGISVQAGTSGFGYSVGARFSEGKTEKDCLVNAICHALHYLYQQKAIFFTDNKRLELLDKLIDQVNNYLKAQQRPKVVQLELF